MSARKSGPKLVEFSLRLSFAETRALYEQLGDIPKSKAGPWILRLHRELAAHLGALEVLNEAGEARKKFGVVK